VAQFVANQRFGYQRLSSAVPSNSSVNVRTNDPAAPIGGSSGRIAGCEFVGTVVVVEVAGATVVVVGATVVVVVVRRGAVVVVVVRRVEVREDAIPSDVA
jgi:hypothetical protein